MKYYLIIDNGSINCRNTLIMDNVLEKGYNSLDSGARSRIGDRNEFVKTLRNGGKCPSSWKIEVITLDDEYYPIPTDGFYLLRINGEFYRILGSYSGYVIGLLAQDLMAKNKCDVENLTGEACSHPSAVKAVRLIDDSVITITCNCFPTRIFN